MNTIKYRALAKDGTWRYGEYPHFAPEMSNTHYPMDVFWDSFLSTFRRETLGLWTGLLDKQGKEIYEGDILKHDIKTFTPFVMEWDNDNGCWTQYAPKNTIKVIGNLYENSELLKGGRK